MKNIFQSLLSSCLLVITLVALSLTVQLAQAQTFRVLYSFTGGTDGGGPRGDLIQDDAGNLYGTTIHGGALGCNPPEGCGTVFKLDMTGRETVLHTFTRPNGAFPSASLIRDAAGNLYGTTYHGGGPYPGWGTVFKVVANGQGKMLYSFTGGADGALPLAGLIRDAAGNLYGTTTAKGGPLGAGTLFKLDTTGQIIVLLTFGAMDGAFPYASLIRDTEGNFYGTTKAGGVGGGGTVFKLDTTGNETVLHNFIGSTGDGLAPYAALIRDTAGNLYGTTTQGGAFHAGTVFKLDAAGNETILHSFTRADGTFPTSALIRDAAGNFYGTAEKGGDFGFGNVFKLDAAGNLTVLHSFTGGDDGAAPIFSGMIQDAAGNFYGTTTGGGVYGKGTVFKIAP